MPLTTRLMAILALALLLLPTGCGQEGGSSAVSHGDSGNKILNLAGKAGSYVVLDMKALNASGLIELIKKNLPDEAEAKLDEVTKGMGVDPFQSFSLLAVWGSDFMKPDGLNIAIVTDMPSEKINQALTYIDGRTKEEKTREQPPMNVAVLGAFDKEIILALTRKSSKELKDLPAEEGISLYRKDDATLGIIDRKAVLAGPSAASIKGLWKSISDASSSGSALLAAGEILKVNAVVNKDKISRIEASIVSQSGDLQIKALVEAIDVETAEQFCGGIKMIPGLALMGAKAMNDKLKEALSKLTADIDGTKVRISLTIPKEALQ
ncbi:MAG: hypothetical protein A2Z34_00285 [Planctomycetes bacterium RBG_16_59_8]|nr:MAG: hypothetical protein A2Z34_00285 [Planctomycetes bacterium RBG_16_59_8]